MSALPFDQVMGNFLSRLGVAGISIIVAALIFGVLAGGVIVHRLETTPTSSQQEQQQGEASDRQDQGQSTSHAHPSPPSEKSDSGESD